MLILFSTRLTGTLKEFWVSIGDYKQQQFFNYITYTAAINESAAIFCRQQGHRIDKIREQFFKLKCCSLLPKDLDKHYQQFCKHFYILGGIDDVNLKQAFLNSVLPELTNQTQL